MTVRSSRSLQATLILASSLAAARLTRRTEVLIDEPVEPAVLVTSIEGFEPSAPPRSTIGTADGVWPPAPRPQFSGFGGNDGDGVPERQY